MGPPLNAVDVADLTYKVVVAAVAVLGLVLGIINAVHARLVSREREQRRYQALKNLRESVGRVQFAVSSILADDLHQTMAPATARDELQVRAGELWEAWDDQERDIPSRRIRRAYWRIHAKADLPGLNDPGAGSEPIGDAARTLDPLLADLRGQIERRL